jgi:hypothetical protein
MMRTVPFAAYTFVVFAFLLSFWVACRTSLVIHLMLKTWRLDG